MIPRRAEIPSRASRSSSSSRSTGNDGSDLDPEGLEVAGAVLGVRDGPQTLHLGDRLAVGGQRSRRRRATTSRQPPQLDQPDRGLQVGHPEVEADLEVLLRRGQEGCVAVSAETLMACSRSLRARSAHVGSGVVIMPPSPVVRILRGWNDHAATSAPAADRPATVGRARAAGRVLDHDDAARVAQRPDRVEVDRHPALVDDDHGPGCRGQGSGDGLAP